MDGMDTAQETLTTAGQKRACAIPGDPWSGTAGGTERESNRVRGIGHRGSQPGSSGVGLSVWKLVLALQGDRGMNTFP